MAVSIKFKTSNAAFEDGKGYEVARILRRIAQELEDSDGRSGSQVTIRDANGNTIGTYYAN
ncbi:MAG: hypothetical protein M3P06_11655 [Acidobacteriota bacterium]|nr:hypothetical protein [Acidobacteriota bacterium]